MRLKFVLLIFCIGLSVASCSQTKLTPNDKPIVITTTEMVADIARNIGGDFISVTSLISPGVDPHQYKCSEKDIIKLAGADIIFYNGLNLEGKLYKILRRAQREIPTYAVGDYIPKEKLIFNGGTPDPHVWFDPNLWIYAVKNVADGLINIDPQNAIYYRKNEELYIRELMECNKNIIKYLEAVPENKRTFITSHNAFSYFNAAYGWNIIGILDVNASGETSVQPLVKTIFERDIKHIFTETSIPSRFADALVASVEAADGTVRRGAPLYSDSLGEYGSGADTYLGMLISNINSIVAEIMSNE